MMKRIYCSVLTLLLVLGSAWAAWAEGLSYVSKITIIKRTNPAYQDFVRQYLNFSDAYSSKECLDFGTKIRQTDESLRYCEMYFRENYGLTVLAAAFIRARINEMKFAPELRNVIYQYLVKAKKYDVEGCNQVWHEWVDGNRKDHQIRKNQIYKESEDICRTFFQP
jgi:hypothetical protein